MREIKFKDFIKLQRGFDLPRKDMIEGIYPVVGSTSIIGWHNEYKLEPPGVVTGRSGSLGAVQYITQKYWAHNTSLWVKDFKGNVPRYVYYFLKEFSLARFNSGAGVPTLNRNDLDNYDIRIHEHNDQIKVSSILSAYDNLIENDDRRIKVLEEMAQTIYDEWLVKFCFPGCNKTRMVKSELEKTPEGWRVEKVKGIVKRLKAGKTYSLKDILSAGSVPVVDQSRDELLGFHNESPSHNASPSNPIIIFGDHTCKMQIMVEPFSLGANVIPFIGVDNIQIPFLFFAIKNLVETQEYKRHWNELIVKRVLVPGEAEQRLFSESITPMLEQINILRKKNLILRASRDVLLPRLISGELDIYDLDIRTEDIE